MPERMALVLAKRAPGGGGAQKTSDLDFDVDAGGEVELHQGIDRLRRRIDNVENALVGANFKLLARFLVDMRRTVDGVLLDPRRQWDRAAHAGAGALRGRDDLLGRRIEHTVIERLEPDEDILRVHFDPSKNPSGTSPPGLSPQASITR